MDKLIEWLFQRTADGATYLQVLIIGGVILVVFRFIFATAKDIYNDLTKGDEDCDEFLSEGM